MINLYQTELSLAANSVFVLFFGAVFVLYVAVLIWKRHIYFGACLVIGTALEMAGYVARVVSIDNYSDTDAFICQIVCLTMAPAFIMAGIYYLLAQILVIHGRQYSRLRPLWFSYIFIFCDVCSLSIQGAGGGLAAVLLVNLRSTDTGTNVMTCGIAFQVFSMSLFLGFFCEFVWKTYFRSSAEVTFLLRNLLDLFLQTPRGKRLQSEHLFSHYNEDYRIIWSRPIFGYYPLAIFSGVLFIYIRCIYRLIEIVEGWSGHLITNEGYLMGLDAAQVLLTCMIFIPLNPGFVMGNSCNISLKNNRQKTTHGQIVNDTLDLQYDDSSILKEKDELSSKRDPRVPYSVSMQTLPPVSADLFIAPQSDILLPIIGLEKPFDLQRQASQYTI